MSKIKPETSSTGFLPTYGNWGGLNYFGGISMSLLEWQLMPQAQIDHLLAQVPGILALDARPPRAGMHDLVAVRRAARQRAGTPGAARKSRCRNDHPVRAMGRAEKLGTTPNLAGAILSGGARCRLMKQTIAA